MPTTTNYIKHYFGEKDDRPAVENGNILYETDTRALFVDQDNVRTRYNPPANWNETNTDDPSYIENKPTLGTASAKNVTNTLAENSQDIPTSGAVYSAIEDLVYDTISTSVFVDENGHLICTLE